MGGGKLQEETESQRTKRRDRGGRRAEQERGQRGGLDSHAGWYGSTRGHRKASGREISREEIEIHRKAACWKKLVDVVNIQKLLSKQFGQVGPPEANQKSLGRAGKVLAR
ncbi:hypothetical protein CKAN_02770400 [Cinnamomum micranthum f. kanehirae]|uniref:Uncharacterized protein n=1 Tax=Cinnamomum micranthum f. kanehirae TaxID=337451 RepID=A0A443Q596_9MAGN|nr:hypothetical protein CKAN_02770400 [Cinnamomum micranthum f. kanehirae]